jgi:hypothetical protein
VAASARISVGTATEATAAPPARRNHVVARGICAW